MTAPDLPPAYPPPHHLLRDLNLHVEHAEDGVSRARMPIVDALRADDGTARLGVLGTLVDVVGGGLAALSAMPDWIATADLTLHVATPSTADVVHATGRVLRRGASTVVLEVLLSERPDDDPYGVATLGFSILPRRDSNLQIDPKSAGRLAMALPESGFAAHVLDEIGLDVIDAPAGAVRMPLTPYVQNSFQALQGGIISLLADVAAEHSLSAAAGRPVAPVDLQMTYLELGKVGPFVTEARVDVVDEGHANARVEVRDDGDGGRLMTIARVSGAVRR